LESEDGETTETVQETFENEGKPKDENDQKVTEEKELGW
jgi:hypothetical protein